MYGFTGTYKGVKVSVQTQGMGFGSAAIVFEELADLGLKKNSQKKYQEFPTS